MLNVKAILAMFSFILRILQSDSYIFKAASLGSGMHECVCVFVHACVHVCLRVCMHA